MALEALIFDFDGVLVDSNDAHVRAWQQAFHRCGHQVAADRIFVELGKGGDRLVPDILGDEAEEKQGDDLRAAHTKALLEIWREEGLRPMPGGEALLADLRRRKVRTALATSSDSDQLAAAEKASRVGWRKLFEQVTTGSDVESTKPAPDLVVAAVHKLGLPPARCAMVGDTPWDARAARGAGVLAIGVTCGGNAPDVLRAAGARLIYGGLDELAADIEAVVNQRLRPSNF